MKKVIIRIMRFLALYLVLVLSFGIYVTSALASLHEKLNNTNFFECVVIVLSFPLIIMTLVHIAQKTKILFVHIKKETNEESEFLDTEYDENKLKQKLICFFVVFVVTLLIFSLEMYALSIISGAKIRIVTLSKISVVASICNALFSIII